MGCVMGFWIGVCGYSGRCGELCSFLVELLICVGDFLTRIGLVLFGV
jgi:hypothetical protein